MPAPVRGRRLWSGRFSGRCTSSSNDSTTPFPSIAGSCRGIFGKRGLSEGLETAGVLTKEDRLRIEEALASIADAVAEDPASIEQANDEDVHSFVERELVARIGDLGKRLHTGRSRNDQVATDLRLWTMQEIDRRIELQSVLQALVDLARRERDAVFPGYTHLQRAQPILFAHWCLAYVEMFRRDAARLSDARRRTRCAPGRRRPLRHRLSHRPRSARDRSGIRAASSNSLDSVSDRDFVLETLSAIATCMHLSRLAEDLVFYASGEARLVELPDGLCSGSSIMPQKKNRMPSN